MRGDAEMAAGERVQEGKEVGGVASCFGELFRRRRGLEAWDEKGEHANSERRS